MFLFNCFRKRFVFFFFYENSLVLGVLLFSKSRYKRFHRRAPSYERRSGEMIPAPLAPPLDPAAIVGIYGSYSSNN